MALPKRWDKAPALDTFANLADRDIPLLEKEAKLTKVPECLTAVSKAKQKLGNFKQLQKKQPPAPEDAKKMMKIVHDLYNAAWKLTSDTIGEQQTEAETEQEPEETSTRWVPTTANLAIFNQLDSDQQKSVKETIEDFNDRGKGKHSHKGVGNVLTLDLTGPAWGGSGRGDWRLQIDTKNKKLGIVNHKGKAWAKPK